MIFGVKMINKKMAVLALGFRPFYLLSSGWAIFAIFEWLLELQGIGFRVFSFLQGMQWHAHEMIFGFAATVVTGFSLTAVRAWTGIDTPKDRSLLALVLLWIAARVGAYTGSILIVSDIIFLPVIAIVIGRLILRAKMYRNLFLPMILMLLGLLNLSFYLAVLGYINLDGNYIIFAALYLIVMIEIMIGNRVIPSFTANAIPGISQYKNQYLTRAAIISSVITFSLLMVSSIGILNAQLCFITAVFHLVLLWGWRPLATRSKPILWILHISYLWIPMGFIFMGLAQLGLMTIYPALHIFGIGATGGLIIAMITRTALGHTGRLLIAGSGEIACYLGIQATLIVWLLANSKHNVWFYPLMVVAGFCWIGVFLVYLIKYFPMLTKPRADGKPG